MTARKLRPLTVGLVLAVVAGLLAWFVWAPRYRPDLHAGEVYGIDVSHHQGDIDWNAVADDGIGFAYIKATEGGDWIDSQFDKNWEHARAAGLKVGAYHFFRTCTDGMLQAQNVLATIPDNGDLPIVIDLEGDGICGGVEPDDPEALLNLEKLVTAVEGSRGEVAFYVLKGFELEAPYSGRAQWRRSLFRRPSGSWIAWQVSFVANVKGVDGPVDLNVGALGE